MHHDHHQGADAPGLAAPELDHHTVVDLAPMGTAGAAPVGLTAAPDVQTPGGNPASTEHETTDTTDCAAQSRQAQDLSRTDKSRATLAALLALKGYSLHELADGSYLASRWNHTRPLRDLHAVLGFARQVGAA